jgi:peptide/nickel transport system permease protein
LLARLRDLRRYPALATGLILIFLFFVVSIYTVIAIPYGEAVEAWRDPTERFDSPRFARPVWFDWFTSDALPRTILLSLESEGAMLTEEPTGNGTKRMEAVLPFDYQYDGFPSELQMRTRWTYADPARRAMVSIYWRKPDGELITMYEGFRSKAGQTFYISSDTDIRDRLGARPETGLFLLDNTVPEDQWEPMKGNYELIVVANMTQSDSLNTARLTVYGRIYGLAGTDHLRRDLMLPLLWGAPIALLFGIFAAVGAQVSTFVLAGIGTWFAGRLEKAMVWMTQVNIIIPILPILIMISHLYQPRLWTILGIVIAFNVFSASFFTYRAMFLQLKEAPYFEAAQAYGAGNFRIIFRYLLPRIAPTLLPQFVMIVPVFVFLEASLAVLGLGDPFLPTWGKLINDARVQSGLYFGHYYWMLQPALLLMAMGFGFALVGYSLDRIFNPRLREL